MVQKSTSLKAKRDLAQTAHDVHDWPEEAGEYTEEDWKIFVKNQRYRAHRDWIEGDLIELARLSKLQRMVVTETQLLDDEGPIVLGGRNGTTRVENPRARFIGTMNGTINTMMRRMGLTVMSISDTRKKATRRENEASIRDQTSPKKAKTHEGRNFLA